MKKKNEYSLDEIKEQRERLQNEIRGLETGFSDRITKIKGELNSITTPVQKIREKPLKSVAIAAGVGFLAGILRRSRKSRKKSSAAPAAPVSPPPSGSGFTSMLMNEMKHLAARKAMFYLSELIDRQISELKDTSDEQ
ncbi:MAG: hypothetical protein LAT80_09585 [Balneolaceae bacterium]|nr:hypothetical protein [Balneolaceae bacterium]